MTMLFIMILPRLTASLHPGNGGNPGFSTYDLDKHMMLVFYPAAIGWIAISVWVFTLKLRSKLIEAKLEE